MPKVVLNADDLGLAENINLGISQAYLNGFLKSVSMVSCGESINQALNLLPLTDLDVGIHLTITQEIPLTHPKFIPSIVANNGKFFSMQEFLMRYLNRKVNFDHVYIEWKNQVEFLLKNGLTIIHMDSHQHLHILPGIIEITQRIKEEYDIKFCRYEPLEPFSNFLKMPKKLPYILTKIIAIINRKARKSNKMHGFVGICFSGGRLRLKHIKEVFSKLKDVPFVELNFHPGLNNSDGAIKYASWKYDWENDLSLLCNIRLVQELKNLGFEPVGFKDL